MAQPKTGRYGKLRVPINNGTQFTNALLTAEASKTIGGVAFTSRFHSNSSGYWNGNPAYPATFRLQGIIGEASISPGAAVDTVATSEISYFKDNSTTTASTAAADTSVSLTRPAAGKTAWYLIQLNLAAGTVSALKGTDITGTHTALLNTFGAAAGEFPLVSAGETIIGAVHLTGTAAATVDGSEITLVDGNGVLLQERSDIPGGKIVLLDGGVLFEEALLKCHEGAVPRLVYASFYSLENSLADVSDFVKWSISTAQAIVTMPGKGDNPTSSEIGGAEVTTGTISSYMVGRKMWDLFRKKIGYVQLFQDIRDLTSYYEGACSWGSIDENNDEAAIMNNLAFTVSGFLERRGTE